MKFTNILVLSVFLMGTSEAVKLTQKSTGLDEDLDNLMDKYDSGESSKKDGKTLVQKDSKKSSGPNKADVQDMELKILTGNDFTSSSAVNADDDMFTEVLEKYETASKKNKGEKILTKDQALDASAEIYQNKKKVDNYEALEKVKSSFAEIWKTHDVQSAGYIDDTEAFSLIQDVIKANE